MDGICQASIRRTRPGASLSGPLHPSGGHLEWTPARIGNRSCPLPLARLEERKSDQRNVTGRGGVHPPFFDACSAQRFREDPPLWISVQSQAEVDGATLPRLASAIGGVDQSALSEATNL